MSQKITEQGVTFNTELWNNTFTPFQKLSCLTVQICWMFPHLLKRVSIAILLPELKYGCQSCHIERT